jgi:hypothetical protein
MFLPILHPSSLAIKGGRPLSSAKDGQPFGA